MRAIFLADAHLRNPTDPNYRALVHFLRNQTGRTDLLVFLGDIFEFWIGKDTPPEEHTGLIDILEDMTRKGTQLVYVEGNHDFHLGPIFSNRLRTKIFPDGGSIDIDGKRVFIAHGDLANPDDLNYMRLRKFLRSGFIKTLIRTLPNPLINAIAGKSSQESRKNAEGKRRKWPAIEILKPYAEEIIAKGHDVVITGHFHQPYSARIGNGEFFALGDWISQYSYVVYEEGTFKLTSHQDSVDSVTTPG